MSFLDSVVGQSVIMALFAGVITSPHCMLMCGPLCLTFTAGSKDREQVMLQLYSYHIARILSYGVTGAFAGLLGRIGLDLLNWEFPTLFSWAICALFVFYALGLKVRIPKSLWLNRQVFKKINALRRSKESLFPIFIGSLTPLLPCAPLYGIFALSLATSSPVLGAQIGIAFGIGTLPLLFLFNSQAYRIRPSLDTRRFQVFLRSAAALSAIIVMMRISYYHESVNDPNQVEFECPMCLQ